MTVTECPPVRKQHDRGHPARSARGEHPRQAHSAGRPLHGRDTERRVIGELLLSAERGRGGVVLVEGEPGIGKSLLLRDAVNEAAGYGFSLAAGPADRIGRSVPFITLLAVLGEPFGRYIAGLSLPERDLPTSPAWWLEQVRRHLEERAASAPVLVCLDDVQWASPSTLTGLRTLPRELRDQPVAWVLSGSSTQRGAYGSLFDLLERDGAVRIGLGPLAADGVAEMLNGAFGAPPDQGLRTLAAGAAGNPWLLAELIGGLRDDDAVRVCGGLATLASDRLPRRLRAVARRRLDGVSKQARHLLTTVAVLGFSFRIEDAAEMLGQTPAVLLDAIEETMAAGITVANENGFSFRHQLLRRAVSDMIPPPGRKALHRQYGQILLGRGECPVAAADHLMHAAATDSPASLAELDAAAERTLPSAPQTAADVASYALELTSPGDPDGLTRAMAAAEALAAAGRIDEASRIARAALAKPVPPAVEARLRCALSSALFSRGETAEAAAEAGKALALALALTELLDGMLDGVLAARLQALAGLHDELARGLAETVLSAPQSHDGHVLATAMVARASVAWDDGRVGESLALLRDAARRPGSVSPDARHAQPLLALATALVDLRQSDEAGLVLDAVEDQAPTVTAARAAAFILRARLHLASGRLDDAAAVAEHAAALAEALGARGHLWAARCLLSVIALRRGDVAGAAERAADGAIAGPHVGDAFARGELATARAQVSQARGEAADALAHARLAFADLEARPGMLLGDPVTAARVARTALAAGDAALAAAVARAAQALAVANPGYPAITAAAAHCLGLVDRDRTRLAEAAAQHPDPWAQGSAAEDLGVLLARQGDAGGAIDCLTRAVRGYDAAGSAPDSARVRRRLRNLGVRRRHWTQSSNRPATGWESLTEAERTASALVAQGLNNRQVADRMYVSIHTVAFYMRQAFRKLSIGSRVELARIVIEQGTAAAG
jgi:DNA-binding CsgD family transcriptional regulator